MVQELEEYNEPDIEFQEEASKPEQNDEVDSDEEAIQKDPVKKFQCHTVEASCIVRNHPETAVVVNTSDEPKEVVVTDDAGHEKAFTVAPGENKIPSNWMRNKDFDVKAFPCKHPSGKFGLDHPRKDKISAKQYFSARLLHHDKRFSSDLSYVFMAQQYMERAAIEAQIDISGMKNCIKICSEHCSGQCSEQWSLVDLIKGFF